MVIDSNRCDQIMIVHYKSGCKRTCDLIVCIHITVESVLTDTMINEEATLYKAAEVEEAKTRSLVLINSHL